MAHKLQLGMGFSFKQLYTVDGTTAIDQAFIKHFAETDIALHNRLAVGRADPSSLDAKSLSDLIVDAAPHVEDFIGQLFGISGEISAMQARHDELAPIYTVKRLFVQRRAVKGVEPEEAEAIDGPAVRADLEDHSANRSPNSATRPMCRSGSTQTMTMKRTKLRLT